MANMGAKFVKFALSISNFSSEIRVVSFSGSESLSNPFNYTISIAVQDEELNLNEIISQAVLLTCVDQDEEVIRLISGIVLSAKYCRSDERFSYYDILTGPPLELLEKRTNSHIFQNLSVPEIVETLLTSASMHSDQFRFDLQKDYSARHYCVQFQETDLGFIERLLSEEGLYYYFEHNEDLNVLVITDNNESHQSISGEVNISFHAADGLLENLNAVKQFVMSENIVSESVQMKDYFFQKPALNLSAEQKLPQFESLSNFQYPGKFGSPEQGANLAQIQLESLQVQRKQGNGSSAWPAMSAGFRFTLIDHPREDLNRDYLIISVSQTGSQPQVLDEFGGSEPSHYINTFQCIPIDVPYRPHRFPSKPKVDGLQTAVVVGPDNEQIYTDEFGRIKIRFHWDKREVSDETSSCWVRVSQTMAGTGWGSVSIPRVGQEVIVDFLNGDMDQPIVTGTLYHATNRQPYPLPDAKSRTVLKTNSTPDGEGFNEISLEDKKGEEQIFVHAERNRDVRVKNDNLEWVGNDQHLIVENNLIDTVHGDKHLTVDGDAIARVDGSLSLTTGADLHLKLAGDLAVDSSADIHIKSGNRMVIEAANGLTLKVGGNFVSIDDAGVTVVGTKINLNSGGSPGSGKGASPDEPLQAAEAASGEVDEPGEAPAEPESYSPSAVIMQQAAMDGAPFCEPCESEEETEA